MLPLKVFLCNICHKLYSVLRKLALPVALTGICLSCYLYKHPVILSVNKEDILLPENKDFLLKGIFAPKDDGGLSSLSNVGFFEKEVDSKMEIISLYLPWGEDFKAEIPISLLDSIYQRGALPMITWEPWGSNFVTKAPAYKNENEILKKINQGVYDSFLIEKAESFKNIHRPVFLRFAHEPDNPSYPWSGMGNNNAEDYKCAWVHVRSLFLSRGAHNVIWVWNPWKAETAEEYFPGKENVDWLGLTILNYGKFNPDKIEYSFKELISPYLKTKPFQLGLPLMIAEMGSLSLAGKQDVWLHKSFDYIRQNKSNIKAAVLFNSGMDKNVPGMTASFIDWKVGKPKKIKKWISKIKDNRDQFDPDMELETGTYLSKISNAVISESRGINYSKGLYWFQDFHILTKENILKDFEEIKDLGISTLKVSGPGRHDENIISGAKENDLKICYSFYVPQGTSFINNDEYLRILKESIIETVKANNSSNTIITWNISSDCLEDSYRRFFKPALLYQKYAYIKWVKEVVSLIQDQDSRRPITLNVGCYDEMVTDIDFIKNEIPAIASFGIDVTDTLFIKKLKTINQPYFISNINPEYYFSHKEISEKVFLSDWQDTWNSNKITFNGLTDLWGVPKKEFYIVSANWSLSPKSLFSPIETIKILKPTDLTHPGYQLIYSALIKKSNKWKLAREEKTDYDYKWYLVKCDNYQKPKLLTQVASGPEVKITIPDNPHLYKIYLLIQSKNESKGILSSLNNRKESIWAKKNR